MNQLLRRLTGPSAGRPAGSRVLDLGCRDGSFPVDCSPFVSVVRLDLELPTGGPCPGFVQADAARLPFPDASFDAIVANHSLEHMHQLAAVLSEIGRVVKPRGRLYVTVPDASTLSDRLYRWVYHGGGHVNLFRSADALGREIAAATGLELVATRVLSTSFGFLQRRRFLPRPPRRMWILGNGDPICIAFLSYAARRLDARLGTRASVYGWELYFGGLDGDVETAIWTNVCAGCGTGYAAEWLRENRRVRRSLVGIESYHCPGCGEWNLFTGDRRP